MIIRYLCLLFLLLMSPQGAQAQDSTYIFINPERMPIARINKECEGWRNYEDRKSCADSAMFAFLHRELRLPAGGCESIPTKTAVVSFLIDERGKASELQFKRKSQNAEWDAEILRVVQLMLNTAGDWETGTFYDKPVPMRVALPIRICVKK